MAYLDLSPAIVSLRERPEEFELVRGNLHHVPSRHMFKFEQEGGVRVIADCNCAIMWTEPEQSKAFFETFRDWQMNYWINREFASHFLPPSRWRRLCARLLSYLLTRHVHAHHAPAVAPRHSMG
ncbi:MAG TPA: hypothetical protein VG271_01500 [Beijerinckiaceae bacterium]|jgi:hypothetical protein|nr:hypothetical protein [Beijerinckiaceae bacterium]